MKFCALALIIFYGYFRTESFVGKVLQHLGYPWNSIIFHHKFPLSKIRKNYQTHLSHKQRLESTDRNSLNNDEELPSPLDKIVDINIDRNTVVYEVCLNREHGFEFTQGLETPVVAKVQPESLAATLGVQRGDFVVATSATVGGQMWYHDTVESVKSALSTRFVLNNNVIIRFERKISQIPEHLLPQITVPYYYYVRLKKPLGLHIKENEQREVIVEKLMPGLAACRSSLIRIGDQIISISATWGDKLWDVKSVESFIVAVNMRSDPYITLKFKRMIPLTSSLERLMQGKSLVMDNFYLYEEEDGRKVHYRNSSKYQLEQSLQLERTAAPLPLKQASERSVPSSEGISGVDEEASQLRSSLLYYDTIEYLKFVKSKEDLTSFWHYLQYNVTKDLKSPLQIENKLANQTIVFNIVDRSRIDTLAINKLMSKALELGDFRLAIEMFEKAFHYDPSSLALDLERGKLRSTLPPPMRLQAKSRGKQGSIEEEEMLEALQSTEEEAEVENSLKISWKTIKQEEKEKHLHLQIVPKKTVDLSQLLYPDPDDPSITLRECLVPNNFILPTIMKAYGRNRQLQRIEYLIPWMELCYNRTADIYAFSSLLYAYAKFKCRAECEYLFYQEIPRRNLTINTVTINSFMYLYTKLNRPMDALKLYDLIKANMKNDRSNPAIAYNPYTFSILIKSLLISNNPRLHSIVFEIIESLPSIGIYPTIELYNQLFEYYATALNYKRVKEVIKKIMEYNRQLKKVFPELGSLLKSEENLLVSFSNGTEGSREEGTPAMTSSTTVMINRPQKIELNLRSYSHIIFCYGTARLPRSALMMYSVMRRQGLSPDKYIYMGLLKALYWLKDYLSSIQIIEEMASQGKVLPDAMHYAQAMQTCLIANKGELAEELMKFYLVQNETALLSSAITGSYPEKFSLTAEQQRHQWKRRTRPQQSSFRSVPPVLCTLWLHSLLQQSKWKEAMILFHRMNEDHTTKMKRITKAFSSKTSDQTDSLYDDLYIGSPNREALEVLLKYQILHERYGDALKTFHQVLLRFSLSPQKSPKARVFSLNRILSLTLGPYASSSYSSSSSAASRSSSDEVRPSENEQLLMFSSYDDYHKIYSKYHSQDQKDPYSSLFNQRNVSGVPSSGLSLEGQLRVDKSKESSVSVIQQESVSVKEEDALTLQEKPMNVEDTASYPLDSGLSPTSSAKNLSLALKFLLRVFRKMGDFPSLLLLSDLYCDFIKAALVEQQYSIARDLLNLRRRNKIHLKIVNEEQLKSSEKFLIQSLISAMPETFLSSSSPARVINTTDHSS